MNPTNKRLPCWRCEYDNPKADAPKLYPGQQCWQCGEVDKRKEDKK